MGTQDHYYVQELRDFRDDVLVSSSTGRKFISWYWRVGPTVARYIECRPVAKFISKYFFILPIVGVIRIIKSETSIKTKP